MQLEKSLEIGQLWNTENILKSCMKPYTENSQFIYRENQQDGFYMVVTLASGELKNNITKKLKFSVTEFITKYEQILRKLQNGSHLLKK